MRKFFLTSAAVLVGLLLIAVASAQTASTLVTFDPSLGELPEAIALDNAGNAFLSMASGEIKRVTRAGETSTFATLPSPGESGFVTGLAFNADGDLFVGFGSFDPATHGIWKVSADGATERSVALDPAILPNGITFNDAGDMFVSDTFGGQILNISPDGQVETWNADKIFAPAEHPPLPFSVGPNGIAFDASFENLYVVAMATGSVLRIPVEADGSAGIIELVARSPELLAGADGIAFDGEGNLWVAVLTADRLAVVDPDGLVRVALEGPPLQNPSDIAFASGTTSGLVTNFAVLRALGLQEGVPQPALLTIDTAAAPATPQPQQPTPPAAITVPSTGHPAEVESVGWLLPAALGVLGVMLIVAARLPDLRRVWDAGRGGD